MGVVFTKQREHKSTGEKTRFLLSHWQKQTYQWRKATQGSLQNLQIPHTALTMPKLHDCFAALFPLIQILSAFMLLLRISVCLQTLLHWFLVHVLKVFFTTLRINCPFFFFFLQKFRFWSMLKKTITAKRHQISRKLSPDHWAFKDLPAAVKVTLWMFSRTSCSSRTQLSQWGDKAQSCPRKTKTM